MSADEHLHPVLFQGASPLRYDRAAGVQRFAVVNPEAALPEERKTAFGTPSHVAETNYWDTKFVQKRSQTGKPLKNPRNFDNPSAAAPGTVSFADVTAHGEDAYIHYMNTRPDQRGQGHASRLVEHIAQQYPGTIHFGKVMSPSVWRMKERLEEQGRRTLGHRDF
jgi:GNAT superfamily N-acetyltransferase